MAYAGVADLDEGLRDARKQLPHDVQVDTATEDAALTNHIAQAQGTIDGYLAGGGYSVSIDSSNVADAGARGRLDAVLRGYVLALVGQQLGGYREGDSEYQRYASAMMELEAIAKRTVFLAGLSPDDIAASSAPALGIQAVSMEGHRAPLRKYRDRRQGWRGARR